ncbi:MAG: molybdopterin molybdenumtransferase MoeA, partial [Undibacterium sp.]|nr:molybdopterin molybdenumtransferase MoeA [Undibacterium sp.]
MNSLSKITQSIPNFRSNTVSVKQAQDIIEQFITPLTGSELGNLHEALGRTLAQDIISPIHVPAYDNSAMDGYAFDGANLASTLYGDLSTNHTLTLK